jgi:hypothetical protein
MHAAVVPTLSDRYSEQLGDISTPKVNKQGYLQVATFSGVVSFARGALNGTRYLTTQNMTQCESILINKLDGNALKIANATVQLQFFKAGWAFLDMVYNVDPITQTCYRSVSEVVNGIIVNYNALEPRVIIDNFIYQFGKIYDSVRDVLLFFTTDDRGEINLPYDAGYGIGNAVYLIFKPAP